ncbi:hypothetical protein [Nevskia sp.]|uniref:hypothetical protein n=1 Tax=Nevskia sp. TaxID=1929292 RepID=UPI0025D64326|nr:hypothetical protein [Nevskia sp.]
MTIFTDRQAAITDLKARIPRVDVLESQVGCMSDSEVFLKLRAAEAEVSRRLRLPLEPTLVLNEDDTTEAEIAALPPGTAFRLEPGYDYAPNFFQQNSWGYLVTRQRPIIELQSYRFVYADSRGSSYEVPREWFRIDKKYGHVRLLPTGSTSLLPLNAYLLSVFSGGSSIPNAIRLRYTAGVRDLQNTHPDLYDFILRVSLLLLIRSSFPGGSGSISADGLSGSESFDIKAYTDAANGSIEGEYKRWTDFFHGVRMVIA